MIIDCNNCSTKFKLDESKITGRGVKVRCTKCHNVFIVHAPEADAPPVEPPVEPSTETQAETQPETSVEAPVETPAETQAETPVETSAAAETAEPDLMRRDQADTLHEEPDTEDEAEEKNETEESTDRLSDDEFGSVEVEDEKQGSDFITCYDTEAEKGPETCDLDFDQNRENKREGETERVSEENDFLLFGFNKEAQGTDYSINFDNEIDINSAEFNLLDDPDDTSEVTEPGDEHEEITEGFTFDTGNTDDTDDTESVDEKTTPPLGEESEAASPEEEVPDSEPHPASVAEPEVPDVPAVSDEADEVSEPQPQDVNEDIEPAEEDEESVDSQLRQLLNSALESVNEEEAGKPSSRGDEPGQEATGETDMSDDSSVPPYEVESRGSKAPIILAVLAIIGLGVLLHITGIADRVLHPSGTSGNELTMAITKMKSYVAKNKEIGPVFVVEAKLLNMTDKPQKVEGVRGTLFNKSGKKLSVRVVSPGRVVSREQIRDMSRKDLMKNFTEAAGGTIPPKGTVPVMLLFLNAPEATTKYSLDVLQ